MMDIKITPHKLCGTVRALPSKSEAHRALILAALSQKPTAICEVGKVGLSDDIIRTVGAIRALGAEVAVDSGRINVTPPADLAENAVIDCGESGSTLRFMIPVCAALGGEFRFIRRGRLPERPIKTLTDALTAHGVSFSADGGDLLMSGRLTGGSFTVSGGESSQYITGILLALPRIGGELYLTGELESAPYIEITLDIMERFGISVAQSKEKDATRFSVCRAPVCASGEVAIGGDWSGAANLLAAGARVSGLDPNSVQGDRAVVDVLQKMGAAVSVESGICASFEKYPRAIDVDMRDTPDLVPLVAVLCAVSQGDSVIHGTRRLRLKESDRVSSTLALLHALGADAGASDDDIFIKGGALCGGEAETFSDHRIAMAAAVASCFADGDVTVRGAECVAKSYPGFWEAFRALGGVFTEI